MTVSQISRENEITQVLTIRSDIKTMNTIVKLVVNNL